MQNILRQEAPDLIHVHSPCLNGIAALPIARRFGLPLVYEMRSLWEDAAVDSGLCREGDLRYRLSRAMETYLCRRVDHVTPIRSCKRIRQLRSVLIEALREVDVSAVLAQQVVEVQRALLPLCVAVEDGKDRPPHDGGLDLSAVLKDLARRDILSVLLEAGPHLNAAALSANLVNKLVLFYAPKISGVSHVPFVSSATKGFPPMRVRIAHRWDRPRRF